MKEKFGAKVDVQFYTSDSQEAKPYTSAFKSSTNVLWDNEWVPITVATDRVKMEEFLSDKI